MNLSLMLLLPSFSLSKEELTARIKETSQQIEENPNNPQLFLKRGWLYKKEGSLSQATRDLKKALYLHPELQTVHLLLAELFFEQQYFYSALIHIQYYVENEKNDPKGYELRGQIFSHQGKDNLAVTDFEKAFQLKGEEASEQDLKRIQKAKSQVLPGVFNWS